MARCGRSWRVLGVGMVGVALVTALAACGADDDATDGDAADGVASGGDVAGGSPSPLVGLLPEDARMVAAIDVAELREALDLPDDQGIDGTLDERTQPLADAVATAIPFFGFPRSMPLREELDTGAMIEAVSVPIALAPQQAVVVVRSSQSFDDLAAALEGRGYEREGDVLVTDARVMEAGATAVTASEDGLLVLAQSAEVARSVAAGEGDGPAAAELLETVEGPLRVGYVSGADSDSCVASVALGWVGPTDGEVVMTVDDSYDPGDLELVPEPDDSGLDGTRLADDFDIEAPQVDGPTLRAGYRWRGRGSPVNAVLTATPGSLFRCP